jgi:hypothetical protein
MERLNAKANAPESLYFREVDDDAPLNIPGMRTIDPVTGEPLLLRVSERLHPQDGPPNVRHPGL